jgi:hypothetical protein
MTGDGLYSLVLASDYRVDDIDRMWSSIKDHRAELAGLGAHHVVVYVGVGEPDRVLVTMGIRHRRSIEELLRSPVMFEWFDMAGVNDIPAIFAGTVVEKIALASDEPEAIPGGVVVGTVSTVGDVADLMVKVRCRLDRFARAGVRKIWVYRAFDDEHEVLTLLQFDDTEAARRWIGQPDAAAEWMPRPPTVRLVEDRDREPGLFLGKLENILTMEATR